MLPEVDLAKPRTLPEALGLLAEHGSHAKPLAGGTNLVVELRDGHHGGKLLVDLSCLQELRGIRRQNGYIVIGGGTTMTDLITHPLTAGRGSLLHECAAVFANPLIRNRATVAGNLVDASPAADTAPPLLALGAEVELASQAGSRWVALSDFMVGVRQTLLRPEELMVSIRWEVPEQAQAGAFYKVGLRKADAISVLSAAVMVVQDETGRCSQARIALGAVAPRPLRAYEAENILLGGRLEPEAIAQAAQLAAGATSPISDIRGTAEYRRRVTEVVVRRLLTEAANNLSGSVPG